MGTYTPPSNHFSLEATVAKVNGNLTLTLGKRPITYNLSPWDGNTFSATCPQWSPAFNGRVPFPAKNYNPEKHFRLKNKIRENFSGKKIKSGKTFPAKK